MLKKEESGKQVSLDKSWGGMSPTKKPRSTIRATVGNYNQQCFENVSGIMARRSEEFHKLCERWNGLDKVTEEHKGVSECLALLEKEQKKAENAKARLSLVAWAPDILNRLKSDKTVILHHPAPRSELLQLLLGVKLEMCARKTPIDIVLFTSEELVSQYLQHVIEQGSQSSQQKRNGLKKIPGLEIRLYEQQWDLKPFEKPTLVFLDTLMCSPDLYLPVYKQISRDSNKQVTVVVYTDNNGLITSTETISLAVNYPVSVVNDCAATWQIQLCKILKDGKLHALHTDVVVFSSSEELKAELLAVLARQKILFKLQTGTTPQDFSLSNVFFSKDEEELAKWNYSYDNVACVYDQGLKTKIIFDYDNRTYVESKRPISTVEMRRRLSCLGLTRPGKYLRGLKGRCRTSDELGECELSKYITRMLFYGFTDKDILEGCSQPAKLAIQSCFSLLKDVKIVNSEHQLQRKEVSRYQIKPFLVPLFLENREPPRLPIILSYVIGLLETAGCLHSDSNKKMDKIWIKSGDLSSSVEILSLLQRIITGGGPLNKDAKKEQEQAPEITEGELEMFGFLYEQFKPKAKLTITEMNEKEFLKELDINSEVAYESLRKAASIRRQFGIDLSDFELTEEDVDKVCELLFTSFNSFGFYTGSRMHGYRMSRTKRDFLPAKNSLLVKLNSRPLIILPLKLIEGDAGKLSIITSNKISDTVFLSVNGELPIMNVKSSYGDKQIEFNNVSNALFEMLWKNKGELINEFEKQHSCMVESNHETSSILIFCEKQQKDRIEKEFQSIIDRFNKDLVIETKLLTLNNLKLVCQKGGSIKEIFNATEDRCLVLCNLPNDTTEIDVKELIEDYAQVEKIELKPGKEGTKTATITFAFKKDIFNVYNELNFAQYDGHRISFEKPEQPEQRNMLPQSCLLFKWYVWKCNKKGSVQFAKAESALKAKQMFDGADFDGRKVKASLKDRTLQLNGLNEQSDEIFLRNALEVYGEIQDIHLDKYTLDEPKNVEHLIEFYIKEYTNKDERFHIKSVKKLAQGLRVAKVGMQEPASIPIVCSALNDKKSLIGQTRLYVTPYYSHPFLVMKGMRKLFVEFLDDVFMDNPPLKPKVETGDFECNGKSYIIVKSKNQDALNRVVAMLTQKLKEHELNLSAEEKAALLTDQGIAKVHAVQQRYLCKFIPKVLQKALSVVCKDQIFSLLYSEVKAIALQPQVLRLAISAKTLRNLIRNPRLEEFKQKFGLETAHLDSIGKSIVMEGKASNLQTARENIPYFLESIASTGGEENAFGMQTCEICCEELNHPYRLQGCGDCFCLDCLMASVNNSFADATTFPIKCPKCRQFLIVRDLINLFDEATWNKLRNIAINDFVGKNSDRYEFCFTGNCQGIHPTNIDEFECEVCQKSYCRKCKMDIHRGLTCQEAKQSTDFLLKKFMEAEDIRICPNPTCKMLLQWVDGCYRVTCSRCQQSMCWKCPRDSMPVYPTAEQCYKHLTDKHGGYW